MNQIRILFQKTHPDVLVPQYQSEGASGCDVHAYIKDDVMIGVGETKLIPTGLKVSIPSGYEIQLRPRSGLSLKTPIRIANSPATIDSDFLGEIGIIVHNCSTTETYIIKPNQKIAQMVVCPVFQAVFIECNEFKSTKRGENGFGSTDTK